MGAKKAPKCVGDSGIVNLAEDLKTLSDPNRLRIVCLLLKGERCVCEVESELSISQQLASHHLNVLKEKGFLVLRREGTSSYYGVDRARLKSMTGVLTAYLDYREEECPSEGDLVCCREISPISGSKPTRRSHKREDRG